MEDHGKIITHFETMFGDRIDHEVIKMILQACDWNSDIAYEQILNLIDTTSGLENKNVSSQSTERESAASVVKKNKPEPLKPIISKVEQNFNQDILSNKIEFIKKLIAEKKKILIIMRGLPGSGKSTLAHSLNTKGIVLSTDDYFYDKFKNYNYNPSILLEAHNWNKDRAKFQIFQGISPIFIDNTNLQIWEFEPYIRSALQSGYFVDILEPQTSWKYDCKMLSKKCIHNITNRKIAEMKERLEDNLSIEDILKKLNLSNNMQDIDLDHYRSLSRNSDPDIVIEVDSSETSEAESITLDSHIECKNDKKIPEDVFEDLIDNFKKFLPPKDAQRKYLSEVAREFAKENNDIDRAKDEAMYKLCSDLEDKMGKPYFSSQSTGEENVACLKEFPDIISKHTISPEISNESLKDWNCVNSADFNDLLSWNTESGENDKETTNSSKPQRVNKSGSCKDFLIPYSSSSGESEDEEAISWDSVNDKSKLSWENDYSLLPTSIHGAIPKKSSKLSINSSVPSSVKFKKDISTQFQTADYSHKNDYKIINCNPSNFISYPLIDIKENEALTKSKLLLEKSTMTSDLHEYEKPRNSTCQLQELKSFFPDIPAEDLQDVLEKCDYDIDWTMNILIDSGYKISSNSSHTQVSQQLYDKKSNPDILEYTKSAHDISSTKKSDHSKCEVQNFENEDGESSDEGNKEDDKYSSSGSNNSLLSDNEDEDSAKDGAQYLTMEINRQFASQLINLFGPISSMNLSSTFTKEDCKIVLPLELCRAIYTSWSETLEGKFQHETDILDMYIREDEELARKLQDEENEAGETFEESTPTSFQKIVEMQKSEENLKLKASKEVTCASMLNMQKLQEEFGHVDPSTVEDEYCNQNFDYSATKTVLAYKYGNSKSVPKTVLATGTVLVHKDDDSPEDEEEENWEDFSIAVDNPQMYRDEAQLHYVERKKALQKAQEASQKGMKSVASYYAQIGNMHMRQFKEANDRASKKIFDAVNSDKGPNTLDLHLLHVDEALRETHRFLSERRNVLHNLNLKQMRVSIITGKGKHSFKGAKLKPAIKTFLTCENCLFKEFSGYFEVTLQSRTKK